jgi:hypothetical protein
MSGIGLGIGKRFLPPSLPDVPRGFAWWYVDLIGAAGEAFVLLWSRRLPFVPSSREAAGAGPLAVALAAYRGGREHFYALQCSDASAASARTPGELRIGESRFRVTGASGEVRLSADLDLSLPGTGRVQARVEVEGVETKLTGGDGGPLDWMPITAAARGRAVLDWAGGSFEIAGRAYFDGNAGTRPLHQLGIEDWRWGRIAMPSRDLVYFQLAPQGGAAAAPVLLSMAPSGEVEDIGGASARFIDGGPGWFGLRRADRLSIRAAREGLDLHFAHQVEDGFFYQRYLVTARSTNGEVGHGIAERVVPSRVAASWHRPLVEMRVDRAGERPSMWLPLFSGSREGRWGRLFASWRGADPEVAP